ncbi:hypothetical protein Tco_1057646 [Tanacetum coccineum]|uniref:TypA/BipA C-terminal domain-containing protein n=1 Tax=Tanacetum coccineum TaxID=301880 RepID=A0ABQ5H663_9ASTR
MGLPGGLPLTCGSVLWKPLTKAEHLEGGQDGVDESGIDQDTRDAYPTGAGPIDADLTIAGPSDVDPTGADPSYAGDTCFSNKVDDILTQQSKASDTAKVIEDAIAMERITILDTIFDSYGPWAGDMSTHDLGSLIAFEDGTVTSYALASSQERGKLFIKVRAEVYKGQIVGIDQRPSDLSLNV